MAGENLQGIYCPWCGCDKMDIVNRTLMCTCSNCDRPMAASEILAQAGEPHHIVTLEGGSFSIQHPLAERLDNGIATCDLHRSLLKAGRPPAPAGRYKAVEVPERGWALISEQNLEDMTSELQEGMKRDIEEMIASGDSRWEIIGSALRDLMDLDADEEEDQG